MAETKYVSQSNLSYILGKIKSTYVQQETGKGLSTNDFTTELLNKLNGIEAGAQVNVLESIKVNGVAQTVSGKAVNIVVPTKTSEITNDSGFITTADIPEGAAASTSVPLMDGTAAVGSELAFARGDHVHPTDTSRAAAADLTSEISRAKAAEQANATAAAEAKAAADAKVASVSAGDASVSVGGTATAPTVAVALSEDADNVITLEDDGLKVVIPAAAEYSIVKAADSGDYAAIYNLTKDGTVVGASINIPKDLVVKSGSVDANGNIVLVLNDESNTEITIDASTLIEYVTSGSATGDMVVINVSDDHKVTATITDGTITLAKLESAVQTKINQAHTHSNKAELDLIASGDKAKWDAVAADYVKASELVALTEAEIDAIWNAA